MAGTYDPAFHQSGSSTPATPSGANPYKANVNRQKTRKWVEAKKIDYGGDDWGGDYDDELEYEPDAPETLDMEIPALPPMASDVSQPHATLTGPRSLQTSASVGSRSREASPVVSPGQASRKPLAGPRLHIQTQQSSQANQQAPTDAGSPWTSNDPHSRRGTPIVEIPVFDRGVSAPRIQVAGQNAGPVAPRFPHRKSSLSQADAADPPFATPLGGPTPFRELDGPPLGSGMRSSSLSGPGSSRATITAPNQPWASGPASDRTRSSSPGTRSVKSPTGQGKPLPFVRPSDIYKNLMEEKEKVRKSLESVRPSMDSVSREGDALGSPTKETNDISVAGTAQQQLIPQQIQEMVEEDTKIEQDPGQTSGTGFKQSTTGTAPSKLEEVRLRPVRTGSSTSIGVKDKASVEKPSSRPNTGISRPTLPVFSDRKSDIEGLIASYERRGGTPTTPTFGLPGPLAPTGSPAQTPASTDIAPAVPEKDSKFKRLIKGHEAGDEGRSAADESAHPPDKERRQGDSLQEGQERPEDELRRLQEELRRLSTSPQLPELTRLSLFGQEFLSSPSSAEAKKDTLILEESLLSPAPLSSPPVVAESSFSPTSAFSHSGDVVEAGQNQERTEIGSATAFESTPTSHLRGTDDVLLWNTSDARPDHSLQETDRDAAVSHPNTGSDASPTTSPQSIGEDSTEPLQGQETDQENLPAVRSHVDEPSKSEYQSGDVATAAPDSAEHVLSGSSLVTSDPQASQLVISSPVPLSAGSAVDVAPPASFDDPTGKLAVPAALSEAKKSYQTSLQVSPEKAEVAEQLDNTLTPQSPSLQPTAEAKTLDLIPEGGQAPSRRLGQLGSDVQDGQTPGSTSATTMDSEISSSGNLAQLDGNVNTQPAVPLKEKAIEQSIHEGISGDTIMPVVPTVAPTLPTTGQSATETFVTASVATSPSTTPGDVSGSGKDADTLSAEILRSIGHTGLLETPEQTPDVADIGSGDNNRMSVHPSGPRESQFLPDLYDDYWSFAGTGSVQEQNMPTISQDTPSAMPDALKTRTEDPRLEPAASAKDEPTHDSSKPSNVGMAGQTLEDNPWAAPGDTGAARHPLTTRFSWERGHAQAATPAASKSWNDRQQDISHPVELSGAEIHELPSPPTHPNAKDVSARPGDENDVPRDAAGAKSGDEIVDHIRNSMLYLSQSEQADGGGVEDKAQSVEQRRPSLGLRSSSSIEAGQSSPPRVRTPVTSSGAWTTSRQAVGVDVSGFKGPLDSHPVLTFREIMEKPSANERVDQFNKAREYYAAAPSGLEAILEHLASLHPDTVVQTGRGLGAASQTYGHQLSKTTTQEPFGAQASTLQNRPHVPRDVQAAASQVGNKTKEFLHGAGKASKGFFSGLKSKTKKDTSENKPLPKPPSHPTEPIYDHLGRIKPKRLHSWTGSVSTHNSLFNAKSETIFRRRSFIVISHVPSPASENILEATNGQHERQDGGRQLQTGETGAQKARPFLAGRSPGSTRRFSLERLIKSLAGPPRVGESPLSYSKGRCGSRARTTSSERPTVSGSNSSLINPAAVSSTSQPPQISRPTTASPIHLAASSYFSALPPTPPPPSPPSKALYDSGHGCDKQSNLLIVPTASETLAASLRPPNSVEKDLNQRRNPDNRSTSPPLDVVDRLRIPLPITKYPPTWDLYTASPLVEEDGFSFRTTSQRQSQTFIEGGQNDISYTVVDSQVDVKTGHRNAADSIAPKFLVHSDDERLSRPGGGDSGMVESGYDEDTQAVPSVGPKPFAMAAYAQQQQALPQQQHFGTQSHPPGLTSRPHSQQAWEQSQDYEYQQQYRPSPQLQQQQGWQAAPSPLAQQQYPQGSPSQQPQNDLSSPPRLPSFIGLPPIRRTSTMMSSVVNAGREDDEDTNSVSSLQQAVQGQVMAHPQQMDRSPSGTHMQVQMQRPMQSIQEQFIPGAYRPMPGDSQISQGQLSSQNDVAHQNNFQSALHGSPQAQHGFQQSPIGTPGARSLSGSAAPGQGMATSNADAQFRGHGQPPGMQPQQPANLMLNGGGPIRLPPNSAFQLVESHLQQPLISPNRNRSASNTPVPSPQPQQQPYFGFDKETGLTASPPTSRGSADDQPRFANGQGSQLAQMRPRTDTDLTEDSALSDRELPKATPASVAQENKSKRNSGIFSVIRDRLSKDAGGEGRRDSAAASESSVATTEIENAPKRRSFSGLLHGAHLPQSHEHNVNSSSPQLNDRMRYVASQGPPNPHGLRLQQERPRSGISGQSPAAEHQRTFLSVSNSSGNLSPSPQDASRPEMPRQSSSVYSSQSANQPSPAHESKQPKKRFSNLKELLRRPGTGEVHGEGHTPPGSAHSGAASSNPIAQGQASSKVSGTPHQGQVQASAIAAGGQVQPRFQGGYHLQLQQGGQQPGQPQQPVPQGQVAQVGHSLRQHPEQHSREPQYGEQLQPPQEHAMQQQQQTPLAQGLQGVQQPSPGYERKASQQVLARTQQANGQRISPLGHLSKGTAQQQAQQQLQPTAQQNLQHRFSMEAQSQQRILQPQHEQLSMITPPPLIGEGRQRSGSTGSARLFTADGYVRPSLDEERGRRSSIAGGGFLSNIFSGRSSSKAREPRKDESPLRSQPQAPPSGPSPSDNGQQAPQYAQVQSGQQFPPGPLYRMAVPHQTGLRQPGQTVNEQSGAQGQPMRDQVQSMPTGLSDQLKQPSHMNGQVNDQSLPASMRQQSGFMEQDSHPPGAQQQRMQQSPSTPGKITQEQRHGQQQQRGTTNVQGFPPREHMYHQGGSPRQQQQQQQQQLAQLQQQKPLGPLNQHPVTTALDSPPQGFTGSPQASHQSLPQQSLAAADKGLSDSSQLAFPVSQLSQPTSYTPVEPPHSGTEVAPALGQSPRQQQPSQSAPTIDSSVRGGTMSRKPVLSSTSQLEPSVTRENQGRQSEQDQRPANVSAVDSVQNSPVQYSRKPETQQLNVEANSQYMTQQRQPMNLPWPVQRISQSPYPVQTGPVQQAVPIQQLPGQGIQLGQQGTLPGQMPRYQQDGGIGVPQPVPNGPPTFAKQSQQLYDPQAPWMLNRPATGGSALPPSRQGQTGSPYVPASQHSNGSSKEHQGTISKLLKGITSSSHHDKHDKEKGGKSSLFGFRKHKQAKSDLKIMHAQPVLNGSQPQQGPPVGSMVHLSPSQDRLRQFQAQVPGQDYQSASNNSPSPGPHTQYQHQRQTPSTGPSPNHTPPAAASGQPSWTVSHQDTSLQQQPQVGAVAPPRGQFQQGQILPLQHANHGRPQQGQDPTLVRQKQMSTSPKPNEPQYAQVPIPGGYGFVRAEGRIEAPSPVAYPVAYYIGPNGQYLPVQASLQGLPRHGQPLMQPGMTPMHPQRQLVQQPHGQSDLSSPSQQPMTSPPPPVVPANTPSLHHPSLETRAHQHLPQQQEEKSIPNAPRHLPVQHVLAVPSPDGLTPRASPNPGALSPLSDIQSPMLGKPLQYDQSTPTLPQVQHTASSEPHTPPDSALPQVNAVPATAFNMDVPGPDISGVAPSSAKSLEHLHVPSRHPSEVSQLSTSQPGGPAPKSSSESNSHEHLQADSPPRSPSLQATPERMVSPEPALRPPPLERDNSIEKANQKHHVEHDNYYDATPRTSTAQLEHPADVGGSRGESEAKRASSNDGDLFTEGQAVQNHTLEIASSPTAVQATAENTRPPGPVQVITSEPAVTEPVPVHPPATSSSVLTSEEPVAADAVPNNSLHITTTAAATNSITPLKPIDIYEEARRKTMLRDMEEKIPVFPTEPDVEGQARAEAEARRKQEDLPQMSATSYPGQEWNPYGGGEDYEEWE